MSNDSENNLAAYALKSTESFGRQFPEDISNNRTEFQRDRERIIHSTAFRRLEYKTQVFVNHEGDMYRTRLTHTIEVAQIARAAARALKINEDLTEVDNSLIVEMPVDKLKESVQAKLLKDGKQLDAINSDNSIYKVGYASTSRWYLYMCIDGTLSSDNKLCIFPHSCQKHFHLYGN